MYCRDDKQLRSAKYPRDVAEAHATFILRRLLSSPPASRDSIDFFRRSSPAIALIDRQLMSFDEIEI